MARTTTILTVLIIATLFLGACSKKPPVTPDSKASATDLLKKLPSATTFEFSNTAFAFSDRNLRAKAVPSERDWLRSDMAEVLGTVGADLEDMLQARSAVEVSTLQLASNAVILTFPQRVIDRLAKKLDRADFEISQTDAVEIFAARRDAGKQLGRMSYAFLDDKLISGDAPTVEQIVEALRGSYEGPTIYENEHIKAVWDRLPDGFTMTVAEGNEHSYLSNLSAVAWGESTRKLDSHYAEETFLANFPTAQQAASASRQIEEGVRSFADLTGRDISVKDTSISGSFVTVRIKTALADLIF
jgi:hypothetical protein